MSAVRSLSLRGRLVVCTTHQPSPDIFSLFDRLTLLAEGRMLYHGTLAGEDHQQRRTQTGRRAAEHGCEPPFT